MPLFIIFKGLGNISQAEKDFLDALPNVRCAFQKNAWANEAYSKMLMWLRSFCDTVQKEDPGNHLLFLDDLSAQQTKSCKDIAIKAGVFPFPIPGGTTEICQPIDRGVAELLKRIMADLYKVELELNYDAWRNFKSNKSLSDSARRMLMAEWVSEAWTFVMEQRQFLHRVCEKSVLITKDGAHRLSVPTQPDYSPF